jgi:superfamily I DNA and/or RNA helicase/very-short-patch-repair endonuclease
LPIRKLLNDQQKGVPNLVKTLKPCWMMSPLSVSQYINADVIHFDVLIFDEASQLKTEDVVSSIIRADQVVVIGDRKQLPPTSFFATGDNEDDDSYEDDASYESVLDECSNFMFGRTLKWHYRSQDERLIAFSNKHFYDSQLVTFPNPVQNQDLGVFFEYVPDGIYDRGGRRDNKLEAEAVAKLALEQFKKNSQQSLGIIAFSEAQTDAIREQLEVLGRNNSDFDIFCNDNSPQFFLKALENVQGDERDVILLSVGYARDSQGKLSLNFGPINKQGGERRLNVAITRAKSKIILVSSIKAGDIDLTRSQSKGLRVLRDYMEYVESGGKKLEGNSYSDKLCFDSPFEEDVYYALVDQGYSIRTQVGCSGYRIDLAVVDKDHPGQFLLGIECDGASYHSSPTARDRDRLRQQVLERLGWKIHRIWSTDWFGNKPTQVGLLVNKIKQLTIQN